MVYSPVTTAAREVDPADGQCVVPLQNRYSFTDLSELTCRWQALAGGKELAHGDSRIAAKPRSSVNATFPATPGMDTLRWNLFTPTGAAFMPRNCTSKAGKARPLLLPWLPPGRFTFRD